MKVLEKLRKYIQNMKRKKKHRIKRMSRIKGKTQKMKKFKG